MRIKKRQAVPRLAHGAVGFGLIVACASFFLPGADAQRASDFPPDAIKTKKRPHAPPVGQTGQPSPTGKSPGARACGSDSYPVPDWVYDARWYYIDVPRFRNGDQSNDPPGTVDWTAIIPGFVERIPRVGGDLVGASARMPYLARLGVNAVVLFAWGESADLSAEKVREMRAFVSAAHEVGIRVIPAVTLKYASNASYLRDVLRLVAYGKRPSVDGFMVPYSSDVADFCRKVKAKRADAVIIPVPDAAFGAGSSPRCVCGFSWQRWSTTVPIWSLVSEDDRAAKEAGRGILGVVLASVFSPFVRVSATARVLAALRSGKNDARMRATNGPPPLERDYAYARLATVLKHFLPGAPITYYGDEVGMYTRSPMWWNDLPDPRTKSPNYRGDFFALVQWLHKVRAEHKPLRRGGFRLVLHDEENKVFSFARTLPGDEVILVMNYGDKKRKVMLPIGKPGQMVVALTPMIDPSRSRLARFTKEKYDHTKIAPLPVGGGRAFVNKDGKVRVWVDAMSIRVVLVNDNEPRRR